MRDRNRNPEHAAPRPDSKPIQANSAPVTPPAETLAQSPDTAAFFVQYHSKLVKSLVARTRSWDEARDIASQAFAEVLGKQPGTVSLLGAYLYRTARNLALNHLHHKAMCKRKEPVLGYEPDTQPSPEFLRTQEERMGVLKKAIDRLPPRLQMVVVLRLWDEKSCEEIASELTSMGVPATARTVQRYLTDGLEFCRQAIAAAESPLDGGPK